MSTSTKAGRNISAEVYEERLQMIKTYDVEHNTNHSTYLSLGPNGIGIRCSLCSGKTVLKDPYDFFSCNQTTKEARGHIFRTSHVNAMAKTNSSVLKQKQQMVKAAIQNSSSRLSEDLKMFRYELVQLCLTNNWSPYSLDNAVTRAFFAKYGKFGNDALTSANHLVREFVPKICQNFDSFTSKLACAKLFSLAVDGTTKVGEWFGTIIRFINIDDPDFIVQRPLLSRYKSSLAEVNHNQLSSTIVRIVNQIQSGAPPEYDEEGQVIFAFNRVVCFMADRVSINRTTFLGDTIRNTFPQAMYIDCHAHTLANTADELNKGCLLFARFWTVHQGLFARAERANDLWLNMAASAMKSYSKTRWFSKRDCMIYVLSRWPTYLAFLDHADYIRAEPDTNFYKMRALLVPRYWPEATYAQSKQTAMLIKLEIAILVDCTKRLHAACYNLEGDGPLSLFAYDEVSDAFYSLEVADIFSFVNVAAVIDEAAQELPADEVADFRRQQRDYVIAKLALPWQYFSNHFIQHPLDRQVKVSDNCFGHILPMWEAMALCNPDFVRRKLLILSQGIPNAGMASLLQFTTDKLECLVNMERITDGLRQRLLAQAEIFFNIGKHVNWGQLTFAKKVDAAKLFWKGYWKDKSIDAWVEFAEICFLHQPSSCSVERLFSVLQNVLTSDRECALDDLIKAGVYERYMAVRRRRAREFYGAAEVEAADLSENED